MVAQLKQGEILERLVRRDRMGISELSRKLNVSRRTIYNWFRQDRLNQVVIWQVCKLLGQDISTAFPDAFIEYNAEQESRTAEQDLLGTETNSVYFWMNKYIHLLEKYNDLLADEKQGTLNDKVSKDYSLGDKRPDTFLYQ
ncbi:helix-turn-helix transcriptional regulator [Pedobacter endophyticus]|uniref:Helix-turn-helix transcriptional regulator n=2 Tax=Pedobacter endophyticus TaxID=2789740 RepID=A0A7S9L2R9_9SPHI|nr:helix-turn-helix transcriptional regulator [Pedobacter endophyticus]